MAFIAVHAKHDITGDKKGILTPSQMAILNAFSLTSKTGILNFGNKCSLVSSSVSAIENKATVTFNSGYIVICGRLVECEQGTTYDITTPNTGTKSSTIILRFNLNGIGKEEFQLTETSNELIQQDLNQNTVTGIYEFPLYKYTATETSVSLTKVETEIIYNFDEKTSLLFTGSGMTGSGKLPLQGYDRSKGTIEERLTETFQTKSLPTISLDFFSCYASMSKWGRKVIATFNLTANSMSETTETTNAVNFHFKPTYKDQELVYSNYIPNEYRPRIPAVGNGYYFAQEKIVSSGSDTVVTENKIAIPILFYVNTDGSITIKKRLSYIADSTLDNYVAVVCSSDTSIYYRKYLVYPFSINIPMAWNLK